MSLKLFSFIFIFIKFFFVKSKFKSYKILSFYLTLKKINVIPTKIMFYLFLCIVIICLIIYIIAIIKRQFIKYHILIILGLLLQLLRVWILYLAVNDNWHKLQIFFDSSVNYIIISSFNKVFILIINLILMNCYPILNCCILILILAYLYKPYSFADIETNYFSYKYIIDPGDLTVFKIVYCSLISLLTIGYYFKCFNNIKKIYNRFIRNIENPIIKKKYRIIRIIFYEVIFFELFSTITFFIYCASDNSDYYFLIFSIYYYLDIFLIMSYFIFYFPTMTFWQNRTNIVVHMIWEVFRGFEDGLLLNGEINFENSFYLMNIYELDPDNIKEDEFFENIDNDSYIIIENPYLSEKNNDMNKLISNNFYYENILVGYIKN